MTYQILKDGTAMKQLIAQEQKKKYCIDMVKWYNTSFAFSNHKYEVREIETGEIETGEIETGKIVYSVDPKVNE